MRVSVSSFLFISLLSIYIVLRPVVLALIGIVTAAAALGFVVLAVLYTYAAVHHDELLTRPRGYR